MKQFNIFGAMAVYGLSSIFAWNVSAQEEELDRAALIESLAAAKAEAKEYQEAYEQIRRANEAMGLSVGSAANGPLQERLLTALSDLRILKEQNDALKKELLTLSELVRIHLEAIADKENDSAESVAMLQSRLDSSAQILADIRETEQPRNAPTETKVISIEPKLSLLVITLGPNSDFKPGSPVLIQRGDRPIAKATVVEIRKYLCGALITENLSDQPKVGDLVRFDVQS